MKIILTHRQPDLDAIVSAWLAQDYLFAMAESEVRFVSRKIPEKARQEADCIVDVGNSYMPERLWFDHKPPAFENRNGTCATRLLWEYLRQQGQDVDHLAPLVQVTFEGDTHRNTLAVKHSRIHGPHAALTGFREHHGSDELVYTKMVQWLRRNMSTNWNLW